MCLAAGLYYVQLNSKACTLYTHDSNTLVHQCKHILNQTKKLCCWATQFCGSLCWWCSDHHLISVLFHTLFYFCLVFLQKMYWWNNDAVSHLLSTPNPHFNRDVRTQTRPVGRSFKRTGSPPAGHREIDFFHVPYCLNDQALLPLTCLYSPALTHAVRNFTHTCVIPSLLTDLRVAAQSVELRERPTLDMPLFRFACMPNFSFCFKLYVYLNHRHLAIIQVPLSTSGLCYFVITPTYTYIYIYIFLNSRIDAHSKGVYCYTASRPSV